MKVSIVGASGYGGGELLRLLLQHPQTLPTVVRLKNLVAFKLKNTSSKATDIFVVFNNKNARRHQVLPPPRFAAAE